MTHGSTAGYASAYDPNDVRPVTKRQVIQLLKRIPWIRVLVDMALVAAILAVSSNFLLVR